MQRNYRKDRLGGNVVAMIDLSACPQRSMDRATYLYILYENVRLSGVTASITASYYISHNRIVRSRSFHRELKGPLKG